MLHVKTFLNQSPIHGTGVYASEDIPQGALIWSFTEGMDRIITEAEYEALPEEVKDFLQTYSYQSSENKNYYLTVDNDRFTNHSDAPNTALKRDGKSYAMRKIAKNEELTIDYKTLDLIACKSRLAA